MKNLIFIVCLMISLAACGEKETSAEQQAAKSIPSVNADSIGMANALHTFFQWYSTTGMGLIDKISFIDQKGKYPKLDEAQLAKYFEEFIKSGVVSAEFVTNETKYYQECATAWKDEESGEVISCMDYDRYYCGQDFEEKEFLSAGVTANITGDRATVMLMLDPKGYNGGPRKFDMKKEDGKWLLSKVGCE